MMTGRDLIIYILQNNLEDSPVFENGRLLGFMTPKEAAAKFRVGESTILAFIELDMLPGVKIGEDVYIPANAENPMKRGRDE